MTYKETTDYLFSQLPMYQRQGKSAFKKDLNNIIRLCEILGNPQNEIKCIHIAGTNGKGSVSHMIAASMQSMGLKVGVYTSPHYKDYRERIKINGTFISEGAVISFVQDYKKDFEEIQPSFFEITVALAFKYFADEGVDVAVIETGLGGRLDSTNIIQPILSVITNISLDHQAMLGDTLPLIAGEKAGIIKPETPVIIGERQEEVSQVFIKKAEEQNAPLEYADDTIAINGDSLYVNDHIWIHEIPDEFSFGYQKKNLITTVAALNKLKRHFDIVPEKVEQGIHSIYELTYYIGRLMKIQEHPLVIFDSAHNEGGVHFLAERIRKESYNQLHIVWGVASDKDLAKTLTLMPEKATYYWAKADIPRGKPSHELREEAAVLGRFGYDYSSVKSAYHIALASASVDDLVIVAGSIFVVAEVL